MSTNVKLLQAMQGIVELGVELEACSRVILDLEQDVNHWRNTANELERKLEASENVCAREAASLDVIEAKLAETLKINENLRVALNEECTKYEKVCGELTEMIEQLEAATELNNYLSSKIKELEAQPADGGKHRG